MYRRRPREFVSLWLIGLLTYGVGDILTTSFVLLLPGLEESNPVVQALLDAFGIIGFVVLKFVVFVMLILISISAAVDGDSVGYYAPPVLATVSGLVLTIWNLRRILGI